METADPVTDANTVNCAWLTEPIIALVENHLPKNVIQWHCSDLQWSFSFFFARIELKLSRQHNGRVTGELVDTYLKIPRTKIDPLRAEIRKTLGPINQPVVRGFDAGIILLQALEVVSEFEDAHGTLTNPKYTNGWTAWDAKLTWDTIVNNPKGLDLSSVKDTAFHLLRKTPEQLCADIPNAFRVIHVESVLRPDLTKAFLSYQSQLEQRMLDESNSSLRKRLPPHSVFSGHALPAVRRDDLIEEMCRPRITYHGTPLRNVASIVRNGFRMPGSWVDGKAVASPRTGIVYNRGIYSSQAPHYALSYASGQMQKTPLGDIPGMRLFVCATLMGRTFRENNVGRSDKVHGHLQEGYDAHFDGGFEYIVHNKRAMLPCYVIHLDLGAEAAQDALRDAQNRPFHFAERQHRTKQYNKLEKEPLAPGEVKREKEMKKAAAMKWFPYGFGSAIGTSFVIEEIGEISDDEEDYGEWQEARHGFARDDIVAVDEDEDDHKWYEEMDENEELTKRRKHGFLDEYQGARKA